MAQEVQVVQEVLVAQVVQEVLEAQVVQEVLVVLEVPVRLALVMHSN